MVCKHKIVDWEPLDLARAMDAGGYRESATIPEVIAAFGRCQDCGKEVCMDYVPNNKIEVFD